MLQRAFAGGTHTAQRITWQRGTAAVNLTGATLTGAIRTDIDDDTTERAIAGDLDIVTAASGIFDWTYTAADLADTGHLWVQFTASYGAGDAEVSPWQVWQVEP